jgi:catechol 2,3-dioxygenase-like lactoylglutathione lyase family enzyme
MIQHVSLECRPDDADALLAFWALLGFAEVDPPAGLAGRTRWCASGAHQVHLLLTGDPVAPPSGHCALVADDYDATLERLRAAGFDADPRTEHWGAPRCFVRAPGGHRVELMAAPPAAAGAPDRP